MYTVHIYSTSLFQLYTILHKHKGGREKLRNDDEEIFDHKHVHQLLQLTTQQEELTSVQCQPCQPCGGPVMYSSVETVDEEEQGGGDGGGGAGGAYHQQQKAEETDEKHYSKVLSEIE